MIRSHLPPVVAVFLACASLAAPLSARAQEAAEWVPTLAILPFRELGKVENQAGATIAEVLTVRFTASDSIRVLDGTVDAEVIRETEIELVSGQSMHSPDRLGVDGVVTGDIFTHNGRLLLSARLTSLADETVRGAWVDVEVSVGLAAAMERLAEKLQVCLNAWADGMREQRRSAVQEQRQTTAPLRNLSGLRIAVDIEENFTRDRHLLLGFAEAAAIQTCQQADMVILQRNDQHGSMDADGLVVRGEAHCDEPLHRDGKAVVAATCTVRLTTAGGSVSLADATVRRTLAAGLAHDAGQAALARAGRDALLSLLAQHARNLQDRRRPQNDDTATVADVEDGRIETDASAKTVCLDVEDERNGLLLAIRELTLLRLADQKDVRPVVRTLVDPTQPFARAAGPSPADLRRPAAQAVIVTLSERVLWGRVLDVRSGELLAARTWPETANVVEVSEQLAGLLVARRKRPPTDEPARWARTEQTPQLHALLLTTPSVRVLPGEYQSILVRERGLGLDAPCLAESVSLRSELSSGRERGKDGTTVRLVSTGADARPLGDVTVFLPGDSPFDERQRLLGESLEPLLLLAAPRPASNRVVQASVGELTGVLGWAKAEAESQRAIDWYRVYPGTADDAEIQALGVLRNACTGEQRGGISQYWFGPATRAAAARLRWEVANGRVRDRRFADRWSVYYAWANWQDVPLADAEQLTDAYLRAYYAGANDADPASPDIILAYQIILTCETKWAWYLKGRVPTFRQREFRQCLARFDSPSTRQIVQEWDMLTGIWRRDAVTPEEHGAALLRALSTTNTLSNLMLASEKYGMDSATTPRRVESDLLVKVLNSTLERVYWLSHETHQEGTTRNGNYGISVARFHAALTAHLATAPRPLYPPVQQVARRLLATVKGRQFGLRDVIRPEDGILPPPREPRAPPPPAPPRPTVEWPAEWLPLSAGGPRPVACYLLWITGPRLGMGRVNGDRLDVLGCDTRTGIWLHGNENAGSLAGATDVRVLGYRSSLKVLEQPYLLDSGRFWRLGPDGSAKEVSLCPALARLGSTDKAIGAGNGILFAVSSESRILFWDSREDTVTELANARSTRAGRLNNRSEWGAVLLESSGDGHNFDLVLTTRVPDSRGSAAFQHWTLDMPSGNATLVRSERCNGQNWAPAMRFEDFLLVEYQLTNELYDRIWHLWPRDPSRPVIHLAGSWSANSGAASKTRLILSKQLGTEADRRSLVIYGDLESGSARRWRVDGVRFSTPNLFRIGDDLIILCSTGITVGDAGVQIIRDAFTRELPPEGTDIQLREAEFKPR